MNATRPQLVAITLGVLLVGAAGGYWFARSQIHSAAPPTSVERTPLYWYDPMKPDQHFNRPGKSPFMDMDLIPKYAEASGDSDSIEVAPALIQNLGIRFTRIERGPLSRSIEAVGLVGFNQRDVAVIQARASGFVTRVYARAPGDVIARDAPIVDLLIPEWSAAQSEFLAVLKSGDHELIGAARQRLVLSGMPPELIASVESSREPHTTITVRSPLAGVIDTLEVRSGMTVSTGATLAKVNGLGTTWIEASIPEAQGALAQLGTTVEAQLTAYPGQRFTGRVIAVLPQANNETRTVRVRIELNNQGGRLRPGMFARVTLDNSEKTPVLYVASEAVIRTGTRAIVILAGEHNRFRPTEVQTGAEVDGKTIILKGVTEGQTVVSSGQFLIDSEANLKGVLARLSGSEQ